MLLYLYTPTEMPSGYCPSIPVGIINYVLYEFRAIDHQEAELMLTNPRDAFRGQSRSPNMVHVPFDMLWFPISVL